MEKNGSILLKVASVLMIIGGILGALASILFVFLGGLLNESSTNAELQEAANKAGSDVSTLAKVLWIVTIITVICSVIEIIAGYKGIKNWNNPYSGKSLMIWGIVCAAIAVIVNVVSVAFGNSVSVISIITGLFVPVLYIIGTIQLQKQA